MTKYAEQSALNLIAGEPVTGKEEWEIRNPAKTSQVVGRVSVATFEQVDDAVQAAAKAAPPEEPITLTPAMPSESSSAAATPAQSAANRCGESGVRP